MNRYYAFYRCKWCQDIVRVGVKSGSMSNSVVMANMPPTLEHQCGKGNPEDDRVAVMERIGVRKVKDYEIESFDDEDYFSV